MRRAAVFALFCALTVHAEEWKIPPAEVAKRWYEGRLKEEKLELDTITLNPIELRGAGAAAVGAELRFFEARAVKNRDGVFASDARRIAVKRDGSAWNWEATIDDLRAVLEACGIRATDENGMRAAASAVLSLPDGGGFEARRAEIAGRTLTYHDHRAEGYFGCGFSGTWFGDATLSFDGEGRLASFDPARSDMHLGAYREHRKAADPWFVDHVCGGEEFMKGMEAREKQRDDLIAALVGSDEPAGAAAERALSRWGGGIEPLLAAAAATASPAGQARIARVRRWIAPEWVKEADEEAKREYEKRVRAEDAGWEVKEFVPIPLVDAAAPLSSAWRLFRAHSVLRLNQQGKDERVLVAKDGALFVWTGDVAEGREVLDRAGVRSDGGEQTRVAVAALMAISINPAKAAAVKVVEPERIEVSGRDGIWHAHRMWLGSGVLGGYTEDVVYVFDAEGLLAEERTTGISNFTRGDMDRLLADADPWLTLEGWVPERMAEKLRIAQAAKEKSPPRHGAKKVMEVR
ncbi:MAG: hypothetical protein K8T20_16530 [Planctomycetes bacterium]|nr:hypothetical protein [Planctomycetota bacterium]